MYFITPVCAVVAGFVLLSFYGALVLLSPLLFLVPKSWPALKLLSSMFIHHRKRERRRDAKGKKRQETEKSERMDKCGDC